MIKKYFGVFLSVFFCIIAVSGCGEKDYNSNKDNFDYENSETFVAVATETNPTVMNMFYRNITNTDMRSDNSYVKNIDVKSEERLKNIENYPDSITAAEGCKTYYISNNGNDTFDGLTPETARATYLSVKTFLQPGDCVLFERGGIWRGQMYLIDGVSYGAYGSGIKPRFYGSVDASENSNGLWEETETPGVYRYSRSVSGCSNIVFNNGEFMANSVNNTDELTKCNLNAYYKNGKIYLYSKNGNPSTIFKTIEIVQDYTLICGDGRGDSNCNINIQNFCVMFAGIHGIQISAAENIEIEGCIIGYIGGKGLYNGDSTSIGNGIEFWGNVYNVTVHDNFIFQAFDEGASNQAVNTKYSVYQGEITYYNNLFEYCSHSISSFIPEKSNENAKDFFKNYTAEFGNIYIKDNISRYCGYGWGGALRRTRKSFEDFKFHSEMHTGVLTIENNIMDRGRKGGIGFNTVPDKKLLSLVDNTFLQYSGRRIMYAVNDVLYMGTDTEYMLNKYFGTYKDNKFILVE